MSGAYSPGFRRDDGSEVRLGSVQRAVLEDCDRESQRRCPGNPTMRALSGHGFVKSRPHVNARTGRPTLQLLWDITPIGRDYLAIGRDRR